MATSKFEAASLSELLSRLAVQALCDADLLSEAALPAAVAALTDCTVDQLSEPARIVAALMFAGFYLPDDKAHMMAYDNLSADQLLVKALESAEYPQSAQTLRDAYALAKKMYGNKRNIAGLTLLEHGAAVANTLLEFKMDLVTVLAGLFNHITAAKDLEQIATTMSSDEITLRVRDLRKLDIYTSKVTERRDNAREEISKQLLQICGDKALTDSPN